MKVAGRKNDGAWFRTNKAIQALNDDERVNLANKIGASDFIDAAYNALVTILDKTGITGIDYAGSKAAWATVMADTGIPRQVWNGNLSWAPYTKVTGGTFVTRTIYLKDGESQMRNFAKDLRRICKEFFMSRRLVRDVFNLGGPNEGNPGGLPDAIKNN